MKRFLTFFFIFASTKVTFVKSVESAIKSACVVTDFKDVASTLELCQNIVLDNLDIPGGETLLLNLTAGSSLSFRGNTTFGYAEWKGPLVIINGTNVVIDGELDSILNGQGDLYWDGHGESGSIKPKFFAITLYNSVMKNIRILNAPMHCAQFFDSSNVSISDWIIDNAAGDSVEGGDVGKNTDGFDVRNGTNLVIRNSIVYNQDDCVALNSGSNILVENLACYGSHGLSLSVGFSKDTFELNSLQNVTIRDSILEGGRNAIHIKTHYDSGKGLIQNITYKNIEFRDVVRYGINIQENYGGPYNSTPTSNVPIRNLIMDNISGSVENSAVPIYILCAEEGCFDWTFTNIFVNGSRDNSCNYLPDGFYC